jgi:hypothetical protein
MLVSTKEDVKALLFQRSVIDDLLVIYIGTDDTFDPDEHTPNFCLDAEKNGKKVSLFLLGTTLKKESRCSNITYFYSKTRYNNSDSISNLSLQDSEIADLLVKLLVSSARLNIALIYQQDIAAIPFYFRLLATDHFDLIQNRVTFIAGFKGSMPGVVYDPRYIVSYEMYHRADLAKSSLRGKEGSYQARAEIGEELSKFMDRFRSSWCELDLNSNSPDYDWLIQQEGNAKKNGLGYHYISLKYLSYDSLFNYELFVNDEFRFNNGLKELIRYLSPSPANGGQIFENKSIPNDNLSIIFINHPNLVEFYINDIQFKHRFATDATIVTLLILNSKLAKFFRQNETVYSYLNELMQKYIDELDETNLWRESSEEETPIAILISQCPSLLMYYLKKVPCIAEKFQPEDWWNVLRHRYLITHLDRLFLLRYLTKFPEIFLHLCNKSDFKRVMKEESDTIQEMYQIELSKIEKPLQQTCTNYEKWNLLGYGIFKSLPIASSSSEDSMAVIQQL